MLDFFTDFADALVPIVAIIAVFGSPVLIALFYFRHLNRREQRLAETLQAMIGSSQEVPLELLQGLMGSRRDDREYLLRRGAIMGSLGIGISLFGWIGADSREVVGIGFLVLAVGLGYLGLAWVRRNNEQAAD